MILSRTAEAWVQRTLGGEQHALEIARMQGSSSSSLYRVRRQNDTFVLRVLDNEKWLAEEPDLVEHEAAALREAGKLAVGAPAPLGFSSEDVGFGAPVVLMTFVEGRIDLRPADFDAWLAALAEELAAIHRHCGESFPWIFESWADRTITEPPVWTRVPGLWARAIEAVRAGEPGYEPVFIHRDYHPMNVLWKESAISGVVDWINACRGPAGVDVAHCRTNLAAMYGADAAERFLNAYISCGGRDFNPYWDLDSLVDMCHPQPTYYDPWLEFGLGEISYNVLCERMDGHLERAMMLID